MNLFIIVILLTLATCENGIAGTKIISYDVTLLDGRKLSYPVNKTDNGDCLYTQQHDTVTCMRKHNYKNVASEWKYRPDDIFYISVNCMKQTFYSYHRHVCICVNGSDAANPGKYKQHDDVHYCHLTTLKEGMFNKLSQLKVLDLSNNGIRNVENNALVGLNSLEYLDLSHNTITTLPEHFLSDIPNIEILKLQNISMDTSYFEKHFIKCKKDLTKLIYIDLSDNKIESVPNQVFDHIQNVQTLILRSNKIQFISESAFYGAIKLEFLDLSGNHLPAMPRAFCDFLYRIGYIDLSSNLLTNFNMNDMNNCDTTEVLDIANNNIKRIKGSLSQRSDLKIFNASGNGLKSISDGFLRNATSVERIDLSLNNLRSFSLAVFTKLGKLKQLDLQGNKFTDTADILTIFNNTKQLVSLNLNSNNIGNIINGTFQALTDLRILNLSRNNISVTHADTFKGLGSLKALFLHHNNIDEINNTTLMHLSSLKTLDLSHNMLHSLDDVKIPMSLTHVNLEQNVFSTFPSSFGNTNVTSLNLKSNVIDDMSGIRNTDLNNLEFLDLSFNQLNSFANVSFVNMTSLADLNLSFNDISGILSSEIFEGTENLTVLNLQKNYIGGLDYFFSSPSTKTITHIDLSYNTIATITALMSHDSINQSDFMLREMNFEHGNLHRIAQDAFLGFLNLRTVNLQNNMIETIQPFNIAYGTEFKLNNNPLQCSCNMSWLSESYVTVNGRKVSTFDYEVDTCVVHPENIKLPVRKVKKNQFRCKIEEGCDSLCKCYSYGNSVKIDYVNCDGLIGNMPEVLSRNAGVIYLDGNRIPNLKLPKHYRADFQTTELYLNRSQISIIENIFFSGFEKLEILDLSRNKISNLPKVIFNNLLNLKKLYLSFNNIKIVSALWFDGLSLQVLNLNANKIQHVNQSFLSILDSMHSLRYVQLHNNPWQCNCNTKDFRIWLKNFGKVVQHRYDIQCFDSKKPLLSIGVSDFECQAVEGHTNRKGIITVLIIVCVCLLLMVAASIYYRRDILAVLYVKLGIGCLRQKYDINRPYDAYLVYDANDTKCSEWINISLLPFLEKRINPYKIVTTERSKLLSALIETESTQLQESKSCVFVINNTVMSNSWCVDCFHRAWSYARKNPNFKLIVIVFGDIEVNLLEEEMRLMLSKGQYITARSRSVWDRLLYELPNPELGIHSVQGDDDVSENDVIIYSATSNTRDEYGSVTIQ